MALTGWLVPKRGFRTCLAAGYLMMGIGVGGLGLAWRALGLPATFCYGVGQGLTIPASNLVVSDSNPARRAAALNILNFAWGLGAMACPFLISLAQAVTSVWAGLLALSAALLLASAAVSLTSAISYCETETRYATTDRGLWRNAYAYVLGLLFFLYVGTESALGGWVASHAKRVAASAATMWVVTPAFFWGALLLGRALAPLVLRRIEESKLVIVGLLIAGGGIAELLLAKNMAGVLMGTGFAGLGLASVFPITIALLSRFGSSASRVAGPLFALAALGGAVVPWLVGLLSTQSGSLKVGLTLPMLGTLVMLVVHASMSRRAVNQFISPVP